MNVLVTVMLSVYVSLVEYLIVKGCHKYKI